MKTKVFIFVLSIFFLSCNLEEADNSTRPTPGLNSKNSNPDIYLINAIRGDEPDHYNLDALLELLLDNAALSGNVLKTLIEEERIPDDFTELCMIVSSPLPTSIISYTKEKRPDINTSNIITAQALSPGMEFSIVNGQRKVIFGKDLERSEIPDCLNTCSSRIRNVDGSPLLIIHWGNDDTDDYMTGCNPAKWVCGKVIETQLIGANGNTVAILITCDSSKRKCFRLPVRAHGSIVTF